MREGGSDNRLFWASRAYPAVPGYPECPGPAECTWGIPGIAGCTRNILDPGFPGISESVYPGISGCPGMSGSAPGVSRARRVYPSFSLEYAPGIFRAGVLREEPDVPGICWIARVLGAVCVPGNIQGANPQGRNPCPYPWQPSEGNALPLGNRPRGMPAAGAATPATSDRYVPRPTTPEETAVQVSGPPATANPQGRQPQRPATGTCLDPPHRRSHVDVV